MLNTNVTHVVVRRHWLHRPGRIRTQPTIGLTTVLDREETREEAIHKLGDLKDAKAVPPLARLLKESPNDRPSVAQTLGIIGDSAAVQPLLFRPSIPIRARAAMKRPTPSIAPTSASFRRWERCMPRRPKTSCSN